VSVRHRTRIGVRLAAALACLALAGCDQFARVGLAERDAGEAAAPPAAPEPDAGEPAARADAGATPLDAGMELECAPIDVAVCNPVTNEGCAGTLQMQCAVDQLAILRGYCIFSSPPPGTGGCINSGVTESCPPTFTCVVDQCQKLCLCDADCDEGQCCTQQVGSTGFKVCRDC
jgi:hypothetical protein